MRSWMRVLSLVALPVLLSAQDFPNPEFRDTAVIPYFQSANPEIVYFQTFYSKELDEQHTLLLVRGGAPRPGRNPAFLPMRYFWWTEGDLLGLFLMETADPSQVWQLAMIPNAPEYHEARLEVDRVDKDSIVLQVFVGDYGGQAPRLKIFFDISSKQLLGQVRFDPVAFRQIAVLPRNRRLQRFFVGSFEENPVVAVWNDLPKDVVPKTPCATCGDLAVDESLGRQSRRHIQQQMYMIGSHMPLHDLDIQRSANLSRRDTLHANFSDTQTPPQVLKGEGVHPSQSGTLSSGPVLVSEEERREVLRFLAESPRRPFGGLSGEPLSVQTDDRDGSVTLLPIDSALPERPTRFFVSLRVSQGTRSVEGVAERTADGYKLYSFPRSTLEDHNRFRPERNERQGREFDWTIEEKIVHYHPDRVQPGRPAEHLELGRTGQPVVGGVAQSVGGRIDAERPAGLETLT